LRGWFLVRTFLFPLLTPPGEWFCFYLPLFFFPCVPALDPGANFFTAVPPPCFEELPVANPNRHRPLPPPPQKSFFWAPIPLLLWGDNFQKLSFSRLPGSYLDSTWVLHNFFLRFDPKNCSVVRTRDNPLIFFSRCFCLFFSARGRGHPPRSFLVLWCSPVG